MTNYERALTLFGGFNAYTPTLKSYFKRVKRYVATPQAGYIVFFYKVSRGDVGHVGIVDSVSFENGIYSITTIEGNTSAGANNTVNPDGGKVAVKRYSFAPGHVGGGNTIDGFGVPLFGEETCSAEQLLAVARSQVGYLEKASNKNLDNPTANAGTANWTKYGAWAAACGWGYNPAAWCAMFVCWCAYTAVVCAHDYVTGWIQHGKDWYFRKDDGSYCADEWLYNGGRWYVFDGSGRMIRGWFKQGKDWYFLAEDGGMCASQWVWQGVYCYYLTSSGLMARSAYVRSDKPYDQGKFIYYWVNEYGAWCPEWDTENPALDIYELAV